MISVCIATYNGEKYIEQQLKSILSQLGPEDEVIISDDGSKDKTIEVIKMINDGRVKVHFNKGSHGYTPNFENALRLSKGDFVFLSDQDDLWASNKVSRCMEELRTHDAVFHDATVINGEGKLLNESLKEIRPSYSSLIGNFYKMGHLGCCTVYNRRIIDMALPFPSNYSLCSHDDWLVELSCAYGKVANIDDKLTYYRRHGNNTSVLISNYSLFEKLSFRAYELFHLLKRGLRNKKV
jgi:glycosyltransferase involved in cell wall biosynthesis